MPFVLTLEEIPHSRKIGEVYVKGESFFCEKNNLLIFKGNTFPPYITNKEIFDQIDQKGIDKVRDIKGEFFIVFYNNTPKKIFLANDKLGRETLFYYHNKTNFIVSDDFWEIIDIIEPESSDINTQSVKEFVIFDRPLFFKTIVKNLNFFPPASIGVFSIRKGEFNLSSYWDFKYEPDETLEINKAVERLDNLLGNALKRIKEKHSKAVFGFGLSGGLDSRLIPHYAVKHKMNLRSFIVGERRPNKLLLSRDHLSARKIAKIYGLNHSEIPYDCTSFEDKSYYELIHTPMAIARFFLTTEENKLPEFDILLTGMNGGELFGSTIPTNIENLNKEELTDAIIRTFSSAYKIRRLPRISFSRARRMSRLITKEDFFKAKSKIQRFVETELNKKKSNIDIFQKYLFCHLISNNKYGSFSMFWKKINYSIFSDPYLFEESLKWKPNFLLDRKLQRYFYVKKLPELAKIPAQDYRPAIFFRKKNSYLRKAFARISYFLCGRGLRYREWAKRKNYLDFARKVLLKGNKFFENKFNVEDIVNCQDPPPENLVKIKQVLDLILTKEYKKIIRARKIIKMR